VTTRWLKQLKPGTGGSVTMHFEDGDFPVEIRINIASSSGPHLEFAHETRDSRRQGEILRYRVDLNWTVPRYGGRRW
jgi:hypothetical protein